MRDIHELTTAIIMAMPRREEIEALSVEELEVLRQYGNRYDNVLYLDVVRRERVVAPSANG